MGGEVGGEDTISQAGQNLAVVNLSETDCEGP